MTGKEAEMSDDEANTLWASGPQGSHCDPPVLLGIERCKITSPI